MTRDANLYAESCSECWRRRTNSHEELLPTEIEGAWEKLAVDLVSIEGHNLLLIVDYGSHFPEVAILQTTSTAAVISALMETFARFGLPRELVSDNGPQLARWEMAQFLRQLGIRHNGSSPRYARSNGMVERFHRLPRTRMTGLQPYLGFHRQLHQVLFDVRNSVTRMIGATPNDALFGRLPRTRVHGLIQPCIINAGHQIRSKADMAANHDAKRGVRQLPILKPGTKVLQWILDITTPIGAPKKCPYIQNVTLSEAGSM